AAEWAQGAHPPATVEPRLVRQPPQAAQLVNGRVLTELEPEPHTGHTPVLPSPTADRHTLPRSGTPAHVLLTVVDGRPVVVGAGDDHLVRVWDVKRSEVLHRIGGHRGGARRRAAAR